MDYGYSFGLNAYGSFERGPMAYRDGASDEIAERSLYIYQLHWVYSSPEMILDAVP